MRRFLLQATTFAAMVATVATVGTAQGRGRNATGYPPGFRPPPGMCRVWINGVPPGQQPGVTDCLTARASAPANSRVIYGDRADNPTYRGRTGIYTRSVYDALGNRVLQRVQRNPNGTISVLSSRPYNKHGDENDEGDNARDRNNEGSRGKGNGHGKVNGHGRGHGDH